eukprot:363847-Chlamydomonas_euryale.AAC.10
MKAARLDVLHNFWSHVYDFTPKAGNWSLLAADAGGVRKLLGSPELPEAADAALGSTSPGALLLTWGDRTPPPSPDYMFVVFPPQVRVCRPCCRCAPPSAYAQRPGGAGRLALECWCRQADARGLVPEGWRLRAGAGGLVPEGWCWRAGAGGLALECWCQRAGAEGLVPQGRCRSAGAGGLALEGWCRRAGARGLVLEGWCRRSGAGMLVPKGWCLRAGTVATSGLKPELTKPELTEPQLWPNGVDQHSVKNACRKARVYCCNRWGSERA